jgi:nucleotide-binding universal stress UspA family protein
MYEEILVPVDGSTDSTGILRHAGDIARRTGARVELLFVADTTRDSLTVVETDVVDVLVDEGEEVVAAAGETLADLGVEYDTEVVQGDPAETIVDYADRYGFDLIVVPTSGRTGLSRYLLGSVAERILRLSTVPVLTARARPDETLTFPYERVLVPTDGSEGARVAARHGIALADALDAAVHVLSVVDDSSLGPDVRSRLSEAGLEEAATDAVEAVAEEASAAGVEEVVTGVAHGSPAETIVEYVEEHGVDAVVMGTSGRRGVDRVLLGSVAERTARTAPVPVITVRDRDGEDAG